MTEHDLHHHNHCSGHTHDSCCADTHNDYHAHDHGAGHSCSSFGHDHGAEMRKLSKNRLIIALCINLSFAFVEVAGGLLTNSLALLADAGHMFNDSLALCVALFAVHLAGKPAQGNRTFGFARAEVLGAFVNSVSLFVVVGFIAWEAFERFGSQNEILAPWMIAIAVIGLAANGAGAFVLFGARKGGVNIEGAFLHMAADALGSIAAIIAGIVILTTGWTPIDIVVSLIICIVIVAGAGRLLKKTLNILLESSPEGISPEIVREKLMTIEHIGEVHCLHIWTITTGVTALSAHIRLKSECEGSHWQKCAAEARKMLSEEFGISHITLQPETGDAICEGCSFKGS